MWCLLLFADVEGRDCLQLPSSAEDFKFLVAPRASAGPAFLLDAHVVWRCRFGGVQLALKIYSHAIDVGGALL